MDSYITGGTIKSLRERKKLTQAELAERLCISDKTVSKWETGKGLPDITLLEPLAEALGISLPELLSGEQIVNQNRSANLLRAKLYTCPICGNVLMATGDAMISCCGVTLPALEAEEPDEEHPIYWEKSDGEYYAALRHPMTRQHYISFIAYVTTDRLELKKLYPEGSAEARFFSRGPGWLYYYCNRHGLFRIKVK